MGTVFFPIRLSRQERMDKVQGNGRRYIKFIDCFHRKRRMNCARDSGNKLDFSPCIRYNEKTGGKAPAVEKEQNDRAAGGFCYA